MSVRGSFSGHVDDHKAEGKSVEDNKSVGTLNLMNNNTRGSSKIFDNHANSKQYWDVSSGSVESDHVVGLHTNLSDCKDHQIGETKERDKKNFSYIGNH